MKSLTVTIIDENDNVLYQATCAEQNSPKTYDATVLDSRRLGDRRSALRIQALALYESMIALRQERAKKNSNVLLEFIYSQQKKNES